MEPTKASEFLTKKPQGFLIVGLGASAGGIGALKEFFEHVPEDTHMAYVVILHLSPDHDSQLAQVLQTVTTLPVTKVTEKLTIEPDHIYVVPPNQHLVMEDGFIAPAVNLYLEERRAPVDIFFRSLADTHGPRAISVILSGTGANGSMGLKRVKERGGAAYVQSPREAEFNEMPRNAIATELIDEVLPVAEIPAHIIAYRNSLGTVEIAVEPEQRPEPQQQALREVFTQMRLRTGHDFSNYKRPTLLRRIERRINIRNLPDLPSYAAFLQQNTDESQALLKDLLISVTNFFRDKKPFEALERDVLPDLLRDKKSEDEIRIWIAGCATGEEAYSLAMLVAERTWGVIDAPKVQLFATDIDEAAIATAREGLYTLNDAADVSAERLLRFFTKEGDHYRIQREIREMILFANHNFLKDPPFARLDLVSCRNVLIYLNGAAQERVMETFHFALRPGGYLFLGTSESVDGASDLYAMVSRENHIYQAREAAIRHYPVPESVPRLQPRQLPAVKATETESRPPSRFSFGELHQKLLEQYAPPSLVVNEAYDIVHMSEKVGSFLEFSGGEPTKNLLKLIKPELRLELRSVLYQALQHQTACEARNVGWTQNGEYQSVTIHVKPVTKAGDTAKGFMLVLFEPGKQEPNPETVVRTADEPIAQQLEEELTGVKAQLRLTAEQHEYQAEELKASNEELQAMNEELHSAAEELETSKEELQSINEELRTVNQELKVKIEEISLTSNNLQNLINSADVATIFLDRAFCIRLYTPAALKLFNLIPSDYGRPISDITHRLEYTGLLDDAQTVLEKLTGIEREIPTTDGRAFMMRVLPYRTKEDRINGVVITFFDITERKRAEVALRESEEKYRTLFESMDEGYLLCEVIFDENKQPVDIRYLEANRAAVRMTGTELVGKTTRQLNPAFEQHWFDTWGRVAKTGINERNEYYAEPLDAWYNFYVFKIGTPSDTKVATVYEDITERKRNEGRQAFLLEVSDAMRAQHSEEAVGVLCTSRLAEYLKVERCYVAWLYPDEDKVYVGPEYRRADLTPASGQYRLSDFPEVVRKVQTETVVICDVAGDPNLSAADKLTLGALDMGAFITAAVRKGNQKVLWAVIVASTRPREWTPGEVTFLENMAERTWTAVERARADEALRTAEEQYRIQLETQVQQRTAELKESRDRYSSLIENTPDAITRWDKELKLVFANSAFESKTGVSKEHLLGKTNREMGQPDELALPYMNSLRRAFETGETVEHFTSFPTPEGEAYLYSRITPEKNAAGEVVTVLAIARDITEIRKAEQEIKQSQELLKATMNSSLDLIQVFEAVRNDQNEIVDFRWILNNYASEKIYGNVIGRNLLALNPGVVQAGIFDTFKRVVETGVTDISERHYVHEQFNGWYYQSVVKLEDGVVTSTVDITERKKAELDIILSQQFLQSVMDSSLDVIQVFDAVRDETSKLVDFTWKGINQRGREQLGEVIGKSVRKQNPGVMASGILDLMVKVVESGVPYEQEQYYAYEQFPNNWFYLTLVKHGDGVILTTKDITSFKKAEAEQLKSLTLLRQSEEVARIGSWEYDIATGDFNWSEGMYRLFGLPVGSLIGLETYADYVLEEDRPVAEKISHALSKGQEPLEETLRIAVDGKTVTLKIKATVLRDQAGKPVKMLGVDMDISEVQRLEQENLKIRLEQQNQLLHAILDAQEEERRRISESLHNGIGQILYATKLNLERLDYEERPGLEEEWRESLQTASELLTEAIKETRRVSHELVPILLKDYGLEQAISELYRRFTGKELQLHCRIDIKGRLESHLELALYRLSQELLNNIVKHSGASQASLQLEKRGAEIVLQASDNGKGFDPDRVRQKGIGLKSMQDRVQLLGGTMNLANQDGKGTQVTIRVPV